MLNINRLFLRRQGKLIADNLDFHLLAGQVILVQGPSGAGKTSILLVLGRLLYPKLFHLSHSKNEKQDTDLALQDESQFMGSFHGKDIDLWNLEQWHRKVHFVPAKPVLISGGSIMEEIQFPRRFKAQNESAMDNDKNSWTNVPALCEALGLDMSLSHPANELSQGQIARLCLARSLFLNPDILLLDEINAFLDSQTSNNVYRQIDQFLDQGKALVLSSHDHNLPPYLTKRIIQRINV